MPVASVASVSILDLFKTNKNRPVAELSIVSESRPINESHITSGIRTKRKRSIEGERPASMKRPALSPKGYPSIRTN